MWIGFHFSNKRCLAFTSVRNILISVNQIQKVYTQEKISDRNDSLILVFTNFFFAHLLINYNKFTNNRAPNKILTKTNIRNITVKLGELRLFKT